MTGPRQNSRCIRSIGAGVLVLAFAGAAVAQSAAKLARGRARPGLAFRIVWFEREDAAQPASITEFRFPVGCDYGSQDIEQVHPVRAGADLREDAHGNLVVSYPGGVPIGDQPVVMGYVNDVVLYPDAALKIKPKYIRESGIPDDVREDFLANEDVLTLEDPGIQRLASELRAEADSELDLALRIWRYVYENVTYSRRVDRPNTAAQVLEWKKGQCGEYSKLAIALLRACDVPARGVWCLRSANTGPMHNDHAWAEAYIEGVGWCPIRTQEEPPDEPLFPLGYHSYLIVCRPRAGMEEYRSVVWENARVPTRYRGAGFFADVPEGKRDASVELFLAIANDDEGNLAPRHLRQIGKAHRAVQPMLYWVLAASVNDEIGQRAAAELVELCGQTSRRLSLERFHAVSPTIVQGRLDDAQGSR